MASPSPFLACSPPTHVVEYESFGAQGDGVTDDLPAICAAHQFANARGLPVRSRPDATYHLGRRALTAEIATDTDWNSSRFIVDDVRAEDRRTPLFEVCSHLEPIELPIHSLQRDQKHLGIEPGRDCYVHVEDDRRRRYIRRGPNRNRGRGQCDNFIVRADGAIDSPIDWDYDRFSSIEIRPIDPVTLKLRGGVFTTIANRIKQERGYSYWSRNIIVRRSNTEVEGLAHHVTGETDVGQPYSGFLRILRCADVTLRDCFASGHRIYRTMGNADTPVAMGSYDYVAKEVTNLRMLGCRMDRIHDRNLWGVIATDFCRNILLEDCVLSRMDTHMGVSGFYTIRDCTLGHMGLNAIGRGRLTIENATIHGDRLIRFRGDYGSTWEGELIIRNCRWIPGRGNRTQQFVVGVSNDGMHDFGYPCTMPRQIVIDGLIFDDADAPDEYEGLYLLTDPDILENVSDSPQLPDLRPYPYTCCKQVIVKNLTTTSGKSARLSPSQRVAAQVQWIGGD